MTALTKKAPAPVSPEKAIQKLSRKHGGGKVEIIYADGGEFYCLVYMVPHMVGAAARDRFHEVADAAGVVTLGAANKLREKIAETPIAMGRGKTINEAVAEAMTVGASK